VTSLVATSTGAVVALTPGHCSGVTACFVVPAVTLVSNAAGPFTLSSTSTVQGYGSGELENTTTSATAGVALSLCYATATAGPWTVFPTSPWAYAEAAEDVTTPDSTMGYIAAGALAAGSYYFALCGLADTTASPSNMAVLSGQAIFTQL